MRAHATLPIAIQLAHAGRKASSRAPWEGGAQIPCERAGRLARASRHRRFRMRVDEEAPDALDRRRHARVRDAFAEAARRAGRLGFDGIELHLAHGYLLHEFLSPLANQRDDAYGGSLENRMRFPLEVFDAVRAAFPADRPVWARLSATDWVDGGWDLEQRRAWRGASTSAAAPRFTCRAAGSRRAQKIPVAPGYQVPLARPLKAEVGLPTIAVGLITEAEQAEAIIANGDADRGRARPRHAVRPALAVARRRDARRARHRAAAVLALAAARVSATCSTAPPSAAAEPIAREAGRFGPLPCAFAARFRRSRAPRAATASRTL